MYATLFSPVRHWCHSPPKRTGSSTFTHWELGRATKAPFSLRIRRIVMTSPTTYCLVSMATTLQHEMKYTSYRLQGCFFLWLFCICPLPLQVCSLNGLVAYGALGPTLVTKRQVVQHARPAEDVSTAGYAGCQRRVEADGTRRHLVTVDALWMHTGEFSFSTSDTSWTVGLIRWAEHWCQWRSFFFDSYSKRTQALTTCCTQSQLTRVSGSMKWTL